MNEQIRQLARQADAMAREIITDLREIPVYNRIRDEKFAELIVRECAEMVRIQNEKFMENESHYGVVSTDVLKHFGFE